MVPRNARVDMTRMDGKARFIGAEMTNNVIDLAYWRGRFKGWRERNRATIKPVGSCFWRHYWTTWVDHDQGSIMRRMRQGDKQVVGRYVAQERRCQRCNQVEIRTVRSYSV